jgi:hypothetical protein
MVVSNRAVGQANNSAPVLGEGGGLVFVRGNGFHGRTNAVDPLLVFLNLLEADAELVAEFCLGNILFDAPKSDSLAQFNVGLSGTARLRLF